MRNEDIERSIAGLDDQLHDALLLSTEYTFAESAERLNITKKQLVQRVAEAKRTVAEKLLGDWQDSESMFLVEMHIDAVAMKMQRHRKSVLHRIRSWLQGVVGQTKTVSGTALLGRIPVSAPFGVVATIALIGIVIYIYPAVESAVENNENIGETIAAVETEAIEAVGPLPSNTESEVQAVPNDERAGASVAPDLFLAASAGTHGVEAALLDIIVSIVSQQQGHRSDLNERVIMAEDEWRSIEDTRRLVDARWGEMEMEERRIELEERRIELEERRIELEERRIELEERRKAAEIRNAELENERVRIEQEYRGRRRGPEYGEAIYRNVESWYNEYRSPMDDYVYEMKNLGDDVKKGYTCPMAELAGEANPVFCL